LPLFEKARIEVYLPDLPKPAYQDLLDALEQEFTYTFGGATILRAESSPVLSEVNKGGGSRRKVVAVQEK
jgi:hypothetical protein